jgi:hypothetical protein
VKAYRFRSLLIGLVNDLAHVRHAGKNGFPAFLRAHLSVKPTRGPQFQAGTSMNQPSLQQEMSTYADVKARCARIVTRLEAIATDSNATPADPRDLFIRLELLSHELHGATFRVRECWWPSANGGGRPRRFGLGRLCRPTRGNLLTEIAQRTLNERLKLRCASCRREQTLPSARLPARWCQNLTDASAARWRLGRDMWSGPRRHIRPAPGGGP